MATKKFPQCDYHLEAWEVARFLAMTDPDFNPEEHVITDVRFHLGGMADGPSRIVVKVVRINDHDGIDLPDYFVNEVAKPLQQPPTA